MDEFPVLISALQHYIYCPRQCALIHIERLWEENRYTAEGRLLHERSDQPQIEKRKGVRTLTALPITNEMLGISGVADVVEFPASRDGERPYPVEYKRGRPKAHRADEVQLCAQALCLEEMFGTTCTEGALYYGKTRRRMAVTFDAELRRLTENIIQATRSLIESGKTPLNSYDAKRCDACSLIEPCQPHVLGRRQSVNAWLEKALKESDAAST